MVTLVIPCDNCINAFSCKRINAGIGFIARDLTNALVEKQKMDLSDIGDLRLCFAVALPIRVSQIFFTYKLGIIWSRMAFKKFSQ